LVAASVDYAHDADQLVVPIVFLLRHAVELSMRQIISRTRVPQRGHDLTEVWAQRREVIESVLGSADPAPLDLLGERIAELQGRDNKAGTRWCTSRLAATRVAESTSWYSLRRADSPCDALDGWDTAIYEYQNADRD
jgi:hypothetical protein